MALVDLRGTTQLPVNDQRVNCVCDSKRRHVVAEYAPDPPTQCGGRRLCQTTEICSGIYSTVPLSFIFLIVVIGMNWEKCEVSFHFITLSPVLIISSSISCQGN